MCRDINHYAELINNPSKTKRLMVLPPGTKVSDTMVHAVKSTGAYVELYHFNANNQLDGFLTPDMKSMVCDNNDYNLRKET